MAHSARKPSAILAFRARDNREIPTAKVDIYGFALTVFTAPLQADISSAWGGRATRSSDIEGLYTLLRKESPARRFALDFSHSCRHDSICSCFLEMRDTCFRENRDVFKDRWCIQLKIWCFFYEYVVFISKDLFIFPNLFRIDRFSYIIHITESFLNERKFNLVYLSYNTYLLFFKWMHWE